MIYDNIIKQVMNNDEITKSRKYNAYKAIKTGYINTAKNDYEYLCYIINGTSSSTGQCVITREYARELLNYSEEEMNTILEVMIAEHITEMQGGMIVI